MTDTGPRPQGTDYATYLLVDDLLELQRPLTPGAHDELLFIVIHQVYELWFRLLLHELDHVDATLTGGDTAAASATLVRVERVDALLLSQLSVLETMSPDGFLQFRDPLAPASGFQSRQFRALEGMGGRLWRAYGAAARAAGLDMPDGDDHPTRSRRLAALRELYRAHAGDAARGLLHRVAEQLLDHDEALARWRSHHVLMAARQIGSRHGTGGSQGVEYLRTTLDQRLFPELWELRALL